LATLLLALALASCGSAAAAPALPDGVLGFNAKRVAGAAAIIAQDAE
jgi:hypothetical protein